MGVEGARCAPRGAVARSVVPLVVMFALAGCGGAEPDRGVELFESGTLERLELDGRVLDDDDDVEYVVMCLWTSSENAPLTIIPDTADADRASIRDIHIHFDRDTLRLTAVDLRVEDDWSRWGEESTGEPPVFRASGHEFSLAAELSGAGGTHELAVSGSCGSPFS